MDMDIGEFHLCNGLMFMRTADGGVRIRLNGQEVAVTTDSGWASVVAHVSARGESSETWAEALAAHNKAAE